MSLPVHRRYDSAMSAIPPTIDTAASIALRTAAVPGPNQLASASSLDWLGTLPPNEETIPGEPLSAATPDVDTIAAGVLSRLGG